MAVMLVALMAISSSLLGSIRLNEVNRESALAEKAMGAALEKLGGADFATVFQRYDSDAGDNPPSGISPGPNFAVPGLDPLPGDADGFVGRIVLPELVVGGSSQLREDLDLPELGMPRDLNGDGHIDDLDHKNDYRILPVLLRVDWAGKAGHRTVKTVTILAHR